MSLCGFYGAVYRLLDAEWGYCSNEAKMEAPYKRFR
jgi:hypothetical protein